MVCFCVYCVYWLHIQWCTSVNIIHSVIADIGDNGYPPPPINQLNEDLLYFAPRGCFNLV
jgi:hypothetical protein